MAFDFPGCFSTTKILRQFFDGWIYPPGSQHVPPKNTFEDDIPFRKVGNVSCLEGNEQMTSQQLESLPLSDSIHLHPATPTQSFNANSTSNTSTGSTSLAQVYVDVQRTHLGLPNDAWRKSPASAHCHPHWPHRVFVGGFVFFKFCPREMCLGKILPKNVWENPVGSNSLPKKTKPPCYFWLETEPPCEPINKYTMCFKISFFETWGSGEDICEENSCCPCHSFCPRPNSTQQKKDQMK